MSLLPLTHDKLRIGLFVRLNGSWFSHPFPTNTFKIKTQKELETLQKLRKVEILWDPEKSDPEVAEAEIPEASPPPLEAQEVESTLQASPIVYDEIPETPEIIDVREAFMLSCESYKKVDRLYQEAFRQSKAVMQDLSSGNIEGIEKAKDMIDDIGGMLEAPDAAAALLSVMNANEMGQGMFVHALNVAALSLLVGREFDFSEAELKTLALGALFHDMGELNVPGKILLKRPNLSPDERDMYRQHPRFGLDMVKRYGGFSKSCLDVIYQHHERLDGSGYPMGLKGVDAISVNARLVMVIDRYDDLCSDPDIERRLTPSEALSHLFVKFRGILWSEAIVVLVRILGVYPPGSLVQLSDQSIGMVININAKNRLRPLVLLHTEKMSTDESLVIDLDQHEELSISQNIRPRDLPRDVVEYLSPKRMINYTILDPTHEMASLPAT